MKNDANSGQGLGLSKQHIEALRNQLDEEEGTITFQLKESNLSSENSDGTILLEIESESESRGLRLWKAEGNELIYDFFIINTGLRRCAVDLGGFQPYENFFVAMTWSDEEISLYLGPKNEEYEGELVGDTSSEVIAQVRQDKNGQLVILGDSGVEVGYYHIRQQGRETLRPRAKEIFDFTEVKCRNLLQVAVDTDQFIIESTIVQQIIVMLVTGIETYLQERFIELCSELGPSEETIASAMAGVSPLSADDFVSQAESEGVPIQELSRGKLLNFQDIGEAHKLYSDVFEFELQTILNETGNRGTLERNIEARHAIIHEATDMTILNIDRVPAQEPVFANHEYGLDIINGFSETVETLHEESESLE